MYQPQKTLSIHGFCKHLSKQLTALATYNQISTIGDENNYALLVGFDCKCSDKCNIEDIQNDCPLYEIADAREFW
ncbi:hypothetical protein [Clostridium sp. MD294]|uniref:hypothetical protein n=1 Tax=Clostridium sp. MD294 TaxID=97138 RepID=UPI0002CAE8E7|nr:hypothetical protein [Clostridium sp. MD294]NDO45851.1 hypothetical protein [Clostridium sp. MD294]USF30493.1 hypothetical protein C820_001934 [Clostridium sp. MD294]